MKDLWTTFTTRFDFFAQLTLEHLLISAVSIIAASIIGLFFGILISEKEKTSGPILTVVNFIYTIPSISLLGLLIPLSGIGNTTAVIALTVYALLPMVRNTHTGIKNIDPAIIEAARGMGSTYTQLLIKIKLPLAFPVIMSGFRNMITMTIALAGIASFIGAGGLGVAIYRGITTNNMDLTVIGSLLIAVLAIVFDLIFGTIEKAFIRHKKNKRNKALIILVCALLIIALVFGLVMTSDTDDKIQLATKPMTEQFIIGEMVKLMIEHDTDLEVEITQGVGGGTSNIEPALEKGEFDLYPEYTGTGWNQVLKKTGIYDESLFDQLEKKYNEKGLTWVGMYGFNNTYGLAVRSEIANKYDLETYSDLAEVAGELTFGAEYDFYEREDGFDPLSEEYGYSFGKTVDLDIGLKYKAISSGEVDVITIFTTDGQLSKADVKVLKDDKHFYPSYMCGNVIRMDTLEKYPQLKAVLEKFDNLLDDATMTELNYAVDEEGKEPKEVAKKFLIEKGMLPGSK